MFTDEDRQTLHRLSRTMARCEQRLDRIERVERRMETEMQIDFTKMTAAATRQVGVTNSVLQVLHDLQVALADTNQKLADAIRDNDPAAIKAAQDQLNAIAQGIEDNDDKLAAAAAAPGQQGTPPPPNA